MSVPQKEPARQVPPDCIPPPVSMKPPTPTPHVRRKPLPWIKQWEFWRFVLATLSLAWEVIKTFLR